jgi:hypothetical protein
MLMGVNTVRVDAPFEADLGPEELQEPATTQYSGRGGGRIALV